MDFRIFILCLSLASLYNCHSMVLDPISYANLTSDSYRIQFPKPDWSLYSDMDANVKYYVEYSIYYEESNGNLREPKRFAAVRDWCIKKYGGYWSGSLYEYGFSKVKAERGYYGVFDYDGYTWVLYMNYGYNN